MKFVSALTLVAAAEGALFGGGLGSMMMLSGGFGGNTASTATHTEGSFGGNSMLPLMMMGGGNSFGGSSMLPLMMMSGGFGGAPSYYTPSSSYYTAPAQSYYQPSATYYQRGTSSDSDSDSEASVAAPGFNSMLPLMMMGGNSFGGSSMLPLMMMGGGFGGSPAPATTGTARGHAAMDSMLPILMMNGGGGGFGGSSMLPLMMMGGGGGLFGGAAPAPAAYYTAPSSYYAPAAEYSSYVAGSYDYGFPGSQSYDYGYPAAAPAAPRYGARGGARMSGAAPRYGGAHAGARNFAPAAHSYPAAPVHQGPVLGGFPQAPVQYTQGAHLGAPITYPAHSYDPVMGR